MTFAQLEVLIALYETGSFTSAALRLGITQSGVSHAIRLLESSLGVKLVERHKSDQKLTDAGSRMLPYARVILAQAESLRQEASAVKGLAKGSLRIGSIGPSSSLKILPDLITKFSSHYPGINVYIDEAPENIVVEWLTDRRIEIGFVLEPDDRFETLPIVNDEFAVILPAAHPLARNDEIAVSSLEGLPFVMTGAGGGVEIQKILAAHKVTPKILFNIPQIISILGIVKSGLGLSMAAKMALPDHYDGVVYRSLNPYAHRKVALATKSINELSPIAKLFWNMAATMTVMEK